MLEVFKNGIVATMDNKKVNNTAYLKVTSVGEKTGLHNRDFHKFFDYKLFIQILLILYYLANL